MESNLVSEQQHCFYQSFNDTRYITQSRSPRVTLVRLGTSLHYGCPQNCQAVSYPKLCQAVPSHSDLIAPSDLLLGRGCLSERKSARKGLLAAVAAGTSRFSAPLCRQEQPGIQMNKREGATQTCMSLKERWTAHQRKRDRS